MKRKKSKKNCQQEIYHDYWLRINPNKNRTSKQALEVVQMMSGVNLASYAMFGVSAFMDCEGEEKEKNGRGREVGDEDGQEEIGGEFASDQVVEEEDGEEEEEPGQERLKEGGRKGLVVSTTSKQ